jgi:Tfp pilus assembly protein PilE
MGVTGREILRWLAQDHILKTSRSEFETLLLEIAEFAEEWLTSAQAMGHAGRPASARVLPWDQTSPQPTRANGRSKPGVAPIRAPARMPVIGDDEEEFAM